MNLEEQQVINIFQELLDKYDKQGVREVRNGHTRVSLFGKQLRFDLSKSFPLLTHRQLFVRGIFQELMWMLRGQTDNKVLTDQNVHIWDQWEGQTDKKNPSQLGKIYGHMWRNFGATDLCHITRPYTTEFLELKGFDQIEWVLNEIKTNPTSSRLIVSGWDPIVSTQTPKEAVLPCCHLLFQFFVEDMTYTERKRWLDNNYDGGGIKAVADYCHTEAPAEDEYRKEEIQEDGFGPMLNHYKVPTSKLSCQLYQRSSDCSTASGYNIAAYSLLTHMIAQQCDLAVGEFIWSIGDIHGYGNQIDDIREMVKRKTHAFPQIKINKAKDLYSYEWSDIEIINYNHSGKMENLKVAI